MPAYSRYLVNLSPELLNYFAVAGFKIEIERIFIYFTHCKASTRPRAQPICITAIGFIVADSKVPFSSRILDLIMFPSP
jgi:hypothetical protein